MHSWYMPLTPASFIRCSLSCTVLLHTHTASKLWFVSTNPLKVAVDRLDEMDHLYNTSMALRPKNRCCGRGMKVGSLLVNSIAYVEKVLATEVIRKPPK